MINPFGRQFCCACDRRQIVAQKAGGEMSLILRTGTMVKASFEMELARVEASAVRKK